MADSVAHCCHIFIFFSHPGKKPQNGGGIGRMLMPSKGNWSECTCFLPLLWQCHVKLFCFSQVLVRQWVHKMDLVDTQIKEWVSPLLQQGAAWVLVRLLVLIYKLCLVHSRLRCSCWCHHGRGDQRQVAVCLFVCFFVLTSLIKGPVSKILWHLLVGKDIASAKDVSYSMIKIKG